jgi:hypothetical protein
MQGKMLTYDELQRLDVWHRMPTITLDEMRGVKLMNRIDTKYILSEEEVVEMLRRASTKGYRVQVIGELRVARYDTLYYDTPKRDMYIVHHNQQLTRQKIRTRTYLDNDLSFLEVKMKSNTGRTRKKRVAIKGEEFANFAQSSDARELLATYGRYDIETLSPALATRFSRITLVNSSLSERLTIDMSLCYEDMRSGRSASIEGMAIVELKQDGRTASIVRDILLDMRIPPLKVSKYCLGTVLTVEGIKKNRYNLKLRDIEHRLGRISIANTNN